jgi:hypothetical protein
MSLEEYICQLRELSDYDTEFTYKNIIQKHEEIIELCQSEITKAKSKIYCLKLKKNLDECIEESHNELQDFLKTIIPIHASLTNTNIDNSGYYSEECEITLSVNSRIIKISYGEEQKNNSRYFSGITHRAILCFSMNDKQERLEACYEDSQYGANNVINGFISLFELKHIEQSVIRNFLSRLFSIFICKTDGYLYSFPITES